MGKGIKLALFVAAISGFSVFINSFAVKAVGNPYFFTTAKNIVVALFFISALIFYNKHKELKKLKKIDWANLVYIGLIGGAIPFLLFFKGMSISLDGAVSGAFIHKTLFIWVALLAFFLLKEKFSFIQYAALGVIFFGILLVGGFNNMSFGVGELMILIATLFWSFEAVFVKNALKRYDAQVAAFGRMFFGAIFMIMFLLYTDNSGAIFSLDQSQFGWIIAASVFLFFYVNFYYGALKYEKATVVASIMTLAFPITVILKSMSQGALTAKPLISAIPILIGIGIIMSPSISSIVKREKNV